MAYHMQSSINYLSHYMHIRYNEFKKEEPCGGFFSLHLLIDVARHKNRIFHTNRAIAAVTSLNNQKIDINHILSLQNQQRRTYDVGGAWVGGYLCFLSKRRRRII